MCAERAVTCLVDIGLLLSKAELGDTLILYLDEEVVLKKFLDEGMFERICGDVCGMVSCDIVVIKYTRSKMGSWICWVGWDVEGSLEALDELYLVVGLGVRRGIAGVCASHGRGWH